MPSTSRPPSLAPGWEGAWLLDVRHVLLALRDRGSLTVPEMALVLRHQALHSDLDHPLGIEHGSLMLTAAILEDAADVVSVDADGRYSVSPELTSFTSPYTGMTVKLHTPEERAGNAARADRERPVRRWNGSLAYDRYRGKWADGRLPGRKHSAADVEEMAETIRALGWLPGSRIVKDQYGVIIDGHRRADALGLLAIDPDTGTDPSSGEPYVEIRSFRNNAARLHFALVANWLTLMAPTRKALSKQVFGDHPVTLEAVRTLLAPLAESAPASPEPTLAPAVPPAPEPIVVKPTELPPYKATKPRRELIARLHHAGTEGLTYKEIDAGGFGAHSRDMLTDLHRYGKVLALTDDMKRDGCRVYIHPDWQQGRPLAPPSPLASPKPVAFANAKVAAMSWLEAAGTSWVHDGKARPYISSGVKADRPVAEHIPGLYRNYMAKSPWYVPMLSDFHIAQTAAVE